MVATCPLFYFWIFGLLFANHVSSSCITEDNQIKGMKQTSCVRFALTSIAMKEIPQDTGILILSFNNLKAICTSTFKGMKQLVELDLSHNALTSFKVDLPIMLQELNLANNSFKSIPDLSQLSSLTRLVLSNNHISTIPDSAFKGLNSLRVLELQKNTIDSLPEQVFHDLKSLDHLDLSHNQLLELPNNLIHNLVHLGKFDLTENKLTNIPDDFFDGLNALAYVYLDKNPWNCNCALHYFKEWVEENEHNIYTTLSDGTPVNEEKSILCSDGTPLIEYNMDTCNSKDFGVVTQYKMTPEKNTPGSKVIQMLPTTAKTTEPWIKKMKTTTVSFSRTTPVLTTEDNQSKGMNQTSCVRFDLTSIAMKEIPQDTGILILSFKNLKAICTSTFKGMKQLVELDLSHNALISFKVDLPIMLQKLNLANNSFKSIPDLSQLSNLTRLVLSNNHISTIPDSAFKGLNSLRVLELQKNTIDSLSEQVFRDLKSLEHLDLSHNQLWELPNNLIHNLVHLGKFDLTENKLTNIPDDFFDGLDYLAYVYLDKNPWNCNCALHYFKEWVEENGHNIYTKLSDGTSVNEEKSILCSDGTPLIEYNMDACNSKDFGVVTQYRMTPGKNTPGSKVIQVLPTTAKTTEPWIKKMKTTRVSFSKTTPVLTTEDNQSKGMNQTSCVRFDLTSIAMKEIPQDTGILILSFKNLKAICTSTFKGMKQLLKLDLSHNALTSFKVDLPIMLQELNLANNSFKSIPDLSQLSSLTRLVLSNNHISTIPDSAFKGLNSLRVLELQKNTIDSLSEQVFCDLKSLNHLDLSHNQLWELPNHLIHNLVHLEKLYLTENKLTNIPDDFFDGLNALAYVYLDENPWNCNCALHYFKEWVEENGHNIYTNLSDGMPVNDEKSILCSDGTPLIEYNMDACNSKDFGVVTQYIMTQKKKYTRK